MLDLLLIAVLSPVAVLACVLVLFVKSARQERQIAALQAELQKIRQAMPDLCADPLETGDAPASRIADAISATRDHTPAARQRPAGEMPTEQAPAPHPAPSVQEADARAPGAASPPAAGSSVESPRMTSAVAANRGSAEPDAPAHVPDQTVPPALLTAIPTVLWSWFRANPLLYTGLCVFLAGIAFTLSYLEQHGHFSLETRLALVGVTGLVMLGAGRLLRSRNSLYGLSLMGGGAVVLYFVLFMAGRLGVLAPASALWIMLVLVLAVALLALAANAQSLAVLSAVGGFAAPILLSTGSGDYVGLFGYYAVLSLGNAFLLRFKAWDMPALISFAAVYGIGGLWGAFYYEPPMFLHLELFLLLFFALFSFMHLQLARHADALDARRAASGSDRREAPVSPLSRNVAQARPGGAASCAGARKAAGIPTRCSGDFSWQAATADAPVTACPGGAPAVAARRYLHASLLFGLPLLTFAYQYRLAQPYPYLAAFSALGLAVWHVGLARLLQDCAGAALGLTREALLILGLGFSVLAVPLALDVSWTGCTWTVQGLGLVWLGLRQDRPLIRSMGYVLQLLAAGAFAGLFRAPERLPLPGILIDERFVCGLLLTLAALVLVRLSRQYRHRLTRKEQPLIRAWQIWAMFWWLVTGCDALSAHLDYQSQLFANAALIFVSVSCALWAWGGAKLRWRVFAASGHLLPLAILISQWRLLPQFGTLLIWPLRFTQPASFLTWGNGGALAVPLACAAFVFWLHLAPKQWQGRRETVTLNSVLLFALGVVSVEAAHRLWDVLPLLGMNWSLLLLAMLTAAWLYLLSRAPFADRLPALLGRAIGACRPWSGLALSLWLACWFAQFCVLAGQAAPLPYIPLLGPLDMAQAFCLLTGLYWLRAMRASDWPLNRTILLCVYRGFGLCAFALGTLIAARAVSWYTYCPYAWKPLLRSSVFQGVLSLLWGSMALILILAASRVFRRRSLWLAGAGLLALTLLKLLLFDLADRDTVSRLVSFLFLGLLMLGLGYFCPLPPKEKQSPAEADDDRNPAPDARRDIQQSGYIVP